MGSRVSSIEVPFTYGFMSKKNIDEKLRKHLLEFTTCWASRVDMVEMQCSNMASGGMAVDGKAILWR